MRAIVQAPALRENPNSLVNVGNRVDTGGDKRWEDGVTFTPIGCETGFAHVPRCVSEDKSPYWDCPAPVIAEPYLLEVGITWSMMDMKVDPKKRITDVLDAITSSLLERASTEGIADVAGATPLTLPTLGGGLVTGGVVGRIMAGETAPPNLSTALDVGGTAATAAAAIGLLEAKLIDAGDHTSAAGTVLISPADLPSAYGTAIIRDSNGRLITTATESKVAVTNIEPGTIFGVGGEIDIYLSEIWVPDFEDRAKNEYVARAERRALAVWNPCEAFKVSYTPA